MAEQPLIVKSVDHLKEVCADVAAICYLLAKLPSAKELKSYKVIWYNRFKKEFQITSFNPFAEEEEGTEIMSIIPEEELEKKTGIIQAIKRGNFYVE